VEIIALIGAALWVTGPAKGHETLFAAGDPRWARFLPLDGIALASLVTSLSLYLYLRSGTRRPALVMDLALVYMVVVAFAIGVMIHWAPPTPALPSSGPFISWVGPVILMFAAIVPAPPGKMLAAGLVAASMNPAGMALSRMAGVFPDTGTSALLMHYPDYLLLGVAVVISHVVTRLGQQVSKEREMGSYRLGSLLGRGGMGEVYLATHRMLARPAAIKLLRPEMLAGRDGSSAELAAARFRREAEAAARLRSPHTVELYDFGVTQEGTLYLVMELLDGLDLETLVQRHGPLPASRTIHLLRQVCESLEEAHARGLVHRDIKPANIHVGRVGLRHDFVKVLDFGLVKSVAGVSDDSLATATGLTPGTPAYMAPEMTRGDPVSGQADIYAVGCVGYYLLTGRLVFEADNAYQMIARHLSAEPIPPSVRGNVALPPGLDRLVLSCLAKNPAQRPDAAELGRALAAIPVEPWTEQDAAHWWRAAANPPVAVG
jgi:serine/threonine-protein kinase